MAYVDFTFYFDVFCGNTLNPENAQKYFIEASDEIDALTFNRLHYAFPTDELHISKVKKAVCAVADALFLIDVQSKAALLQKSENGYTGGIISSVSSGKESISYANNSTQNSVYALAASNNAEKSKLINEIAVRYLANIPDSNGVNLLYAGW